MMGRRPATMGADRPFLELSGVSKAFGATIANQAVDLKLWPGEILGVVGENGAGKSTLMNIIAGLLAPDAGEIVLDGRVVDFSSPRDAAAAGIGMVHQHFKLIGSLTVAENIALGDPRWGRGRLRFAPLRADIGALAAELGVTIDFDRHIDDLTVGEQQRVEILKVLSRRPRLLILDEPTAVLTQDERPGLFRVIGELATHGTAVIIISHKLEDILETCDRVTVMRHGRVVDTAEVAGRSRADLVRMIVGDNLPALTRETGGDGARAPLLTVENVMVRRPNGTLAVNDASFTLISAEILGLCGVDGNGQSELVQALAGMFRPIAGHIHYHLNGAADGWLDAAELRRLGLCHIPEDRHRHGMLAGLPLTENYLMTHLGQREFNRRGWLQGRAIAARVEEAVATFEVKAPGLQATMSQLSGGNQQKLVLAREFAAAPRIVVAAHPTRGLDVRTIAFVKQQLLSMRKRGAGILLLSADLPEVWEIADRVMVMTAGQLRGPVAVAETTLQEVGHWMTAR
jgi:general nucleoside transport system ATP-binding protein